ncbi:MAG: hypothetical protein ACPL0D_03150 [Thermosulfidibacteraceae bacterium]|jgi:nitrogen-specific signal transduction histidine kinase
MKDNITTVTNKGQVTNFREIVEELPYPLLIINNALIIDYANPASYYIFPKFNTLTGKSLLEIIRDEETLDIIRKAITNSYPVLNYKISITEETTRNFIIDVFSVKLQKEEKYVMILKEISQLEILELKEEKTKQLKIIEETLSYIVNRLLQKIEALISISELIVEKSNIEESFMIKKITKEVYEYLKDINELLSKEEIIMNSNIHKIVENSLMIVEELLKDKKIKIVKNYDPTIPEIMINPITLVKSISNITLLLSNFLKEKDVITISTKYLNNIMLKPDRKSVLIEFKITTKNVREINSVLLETNNPKLLLSYKIISDNGGLIDTVCKDRSISIRIILPT